MRFFPLKKKHFKQNIAPDYINSLYSSKFEANVFLGASICITHVWSVDVIDFKSSLNHCAMECSEEI